LQTAADEFGQEFLGVDVAGVGPGDEFVCDRCGHAAGDDGRGLLRTVDGGRGTGELRDRFSGTRGDVAQALWHTGALLYSGRDRTRSFCGRVIHGLVAVTLDPYEFDFTAAQRYVEELEQVLVDDVLAIGFLPSSPLAAGHPLRQGVDYVLGVAEYLEVLTAVRCRPEQ